VVEQRNGTSTTAAQRYLPQGVQQGTSKFFYTRDHLGSIREVVNNSGGVVARYDYDPYGRRTKLSGTFDSDFGFTGHYYHVPSGLHFAPFRAYSAEFGRWLTRDPILETGGINLYAYVIGNPVNRIDTLGFCYGPYPGVNIPTTDAERAASATGLGQGAALAGGAGVGLLAGETVALSAIGTAVLAARAAISNPALVVGAVNAIGEFALGYGLPGPPNPNLPSIIGATISELEKIGPKPPYGPEPCPRPLNPDLQVIPSEPEEPEAPCETASRDETKRQG